jgi:GNAT superfamily N-acetyltransferase
MRYLVSTLALLYDVDIPNYKFLVLEALQKYPQNFSFSFADVIDKPDEYWQEMIKTAYGCWVGGELIGVMSLKQDTGFSTHCADISFVYVRPNFQRQGYGLFMINSIECFAVIKGIEKLFLTLVHNNPALGLYKKVGYFETGFEEDIRRINGVSYNRFCMQKNLT